MAQLATLQMFDSQATPVAHVFAPASHSSTDFVWRETNTSSVLNAMLLTLSRLPMKKGSDLEKSRVKLVMPVLETITGSNSSGYTAAPRLAYTLQGIVDFIMPARATTVQRTDLVKYVRQVITESGYSQISDATINNSWPY